jgi:tetratricopeptide (TPR) repeat protein
MTPNRWTIALVSMLAWCNGRPAWAQDSVRLETDPAKPLVGTIQKESPAGIEMTVRSKKLFIAADDINDVVYNAPGGIRIGAGGYQSAMNNEAKAATGTAADRKKALADAIHDYEKVAERAGTKYPLLARHALFKVATLTALQAEETGSSTKEAIKLLEDFKAKHADGWQITRAARLLAQMLAEDDKFDQAEKVYVDLANNADLPKEASGQFQLLAAQLSMRPGKYAVAQAKLQALIDKLPQNSPARARAEISLAECQAETSLAKLPKDAEVEVKAKIIADAVGKLNGVLDANKEDKELRARAYNALGHCRLAAGQYKEALWDYLRVDVVYHQNREEHAKALYHLAILFDDLKDGERAKDCRARLSGKQLAGTDYQRRLAREAAEKK